MKKPLKKLPNKVKYKYFFTKNLKKKNFKNTEMFKGCVGFRCLKSAKVCYSEIESIRRTLYFNFKSVKIWYNLEFNVAVRSKSSESRMGKGKGKIVGWAAHVNKGSVFMELGNIYSRDLELKLVKAVLKKTSLDCLVIYKPLFSYCFNNYGSKS